jgi:hypothetical protein
MAGLYHYFRQVTTRDQCLCVSRVSPPEDTEGTDYEANWGIRGQVI